MRIENVIIIACLLPLALSLGACDAGESSGKTEVAAAANAPELEPGKTAGSFQLQAVVELVNGEAVGDAAALEVKINDPEAKLNAVDLDDDGVTDFVEVVEVVDGDETTLQFRAIPSTKKGQPAKEVGVVIAEVSLEVENEETLVVHGIYTKHIDHDVGIHVYHHEEPVTYDHGVLVVSDSHFHHYVFVHEHEAYHGHHHYVVVDTHEVHHEVHHDVHVHKKHKKHKKHKGHKGKKGKKGHEGHGGHGGHGGGVVVTW